MPPAICLSCRHYDDGECGDDGSRLDGPCCLLNVRFPTRRGFCWRHQPRRLSPCVMREGSADVPQPWITLELYGTLWGLRASSWRALERMKGAEHGARVGDL